MSSDLSPYAQELKLNALNEIDFGAYRIIDEEWGISILEDNPKVYLFIGEEYLEEDESVEYDLHVYVVDDEHLDIVDEWVVDARNEALETQKSFPHLDLATEIEVDGKNYHIFIMYSAD